MVMKLNRCFFTPMKEAKKLCPFTQSRMSDKGPNTVDMTVGPPEEDGGRRGTSRQEVVIEEKE